MRKQIWEIGNRFQKVTVSKPISRLKNYFRFTALEDSEIVLTGFVYGPESSEDHVTPDVNLEYSFDGKSWETWNYQTKLSKGQTMYLKGNNEQGFSKIYDTDEWFGTWNVFNAYSYGVCECKGNIMSLLYGDDFEGKVTIPSNWCFSALFDCERSMLDDKCLLITTAPDLPATTLAEGCYSGMFYGCSSLVTAPTLQATTLAGGCYESMFANCTSLTTAPALPATTLASFCYAGMFSDCTSLVVAPKLPATTLAEICYNSMFLGCTSLTTVPELPAPKLAYYCYYDMFNGCTSLNHIKMLAIDISAEDCLNGWVYNVAENGTFIKHPDMNSLPVGESGIPNGWTVEDAVI